ncbi:MAG TPA: M14 family metallopeptidase [Caldisericia bacterium]|nr:M14 family metallopeptidase [Caldisericia bacterium]HPF48446.1 M14 family metallopeptidase [Caldisericia bacterium]HPI83374.1 M14 family metallopeptidase [Caldisericia bacterium]HPQ92900.1 M14 family metallopeptidase [Caldisericia bacterium]HRV74002.1 M14 family metallopeptidase [Caldisericia bacterium]
MNVMKKAAFLVLLCLFLLPGLKNSKVYHLISTKTPIGEVVHYEQGEDYICLVEGNSVPDDAVVIQTVADVTEPGDFHTYEEVVSTLTFLSEEYPDRCGLRVVGTSYEGHPIPALRFSLDNTYKPAFLIMGCHHAREWMSVEIPMALCDVLSKNPENNPDIDRWLSEYEIWVIPMLNPDGHIYSVEEDRMWRKNRKVFTSTIGVDLNRNYSHMWSKMGSSDNGSSEVYRGKEAFSENETQIIRDLAKQIPFIGCISYHTYGDLVLYPWAYSYERVYCEDILADIAYNMAKVAGPPDDNDRKSSTAKYAQELDYLPMKGSDLYPTAGECGDYLFSTHGIAGFTVEIGNKANDFIPPDTLIEPTVKQIIGMNYVLFNRTPELFAVVQGFVKDSLGNPVDAKFLFGKDSFPIEIDPVTGFFRKVEPVGRHLIKLEWPDGTEVREMIDVAPGINTLEYLWDGREMSNLEGIITNSVGDVSQATINLYDTATRTEIASGIFTGEYKFTGIKTGVYELKVTTTDGVSRIYHLGISDHTRFDITTNFGAY